MRCRRCGRILRDPQSIQIGYGPVCYEKEFGCSLTFGDERTTEPEIPDVPGQMSINGFFLFDFEREEIWHL